MFISKKNNIIIGAEATSGLQVIFLLCVFDKIKKQGSIKKIDIFFFNTGVYDEAIIKIKKVLAKTNFHFNFIDCREKKIQKLDNIKIIYDYFIVRSRISVHQHNQLNYQRSFFIKTGNCKNVNIALAKLKYRKLYSVDDGLSNWRRESNIFSIRNFFPRFQRNDQGKRILAYNHKFFSREITSRNVVHYSIFSKNKNKNLLSSFSNNLKKVSNSYPKFIDVEVLYVGVWPASPYRNTDKQKVQKDDDQVNIFFSIIDKENKFKEVIHYKEHPKFSLKPLNSEKFKFEKIKEIYNDAPLELIINSLTNLKEIYGFPSTGLFLINALKLKNIKINIIIKKDDPVYYSDLEYLFYDKAFNLIYID